MVISTSMLKEFEESLRKKHRELLHAAVESDESNEPVEHDHSMVGRLSRMDAIQAHAMSAEARRRLEIELKRVETALERIQQGNYGICLVCDEDIAVERLRSSPEIPLCRECAENAGNQ